MCDVLVVEDDFMVARTHERVVDQSPGFRVVGVAHTGAEALELIGGLRPQLVLLDMYLPDMSGLDVIRRSREAGDEVDFLVLSAAREADMVTAALQGGIVSYLLKPFKISELQARLAGYAERRRVLGGSGELEQSDLDLAFGSVAAPTSAASAVASLPKGLSRETAALIERELKERKPDVAASECGEILGLSRVVARKYLEYFVHRGDATVTHRYGHTGRPQRRYSWVGR
ncbi:response regulator [Luethyella okanaganae]|uniref:Transcriptional regulatory protein n=1 Tax=Luethyella okanaganae TaxID=69372 RepID=A0ABW1VAY9_9MICO